MLFNSKQFNTGMFGGGETIATVYSTDTLVFNGTSLSDGESMVMESLKLLGPTRTIVSGDIPRGDGQYVTGDYFREYVIEARGILKAATASALRTAMDTLRKNLRVREANLDITEANSRVKRFIATCDNFEEIFGDEEHYHITFVPFVIRFKCKTPFANARTYSSTFLTFGTSPTTQSIVNEGTYKAQPTFLINFLTASSVTAATVTNSTTGESITYTGSLTASDLLIFDSEMKAVTKNGVAADYSGTFPTLDVGANLITITITASSFSVETTYRHKTTYL